MIDLESMNVLIVDDMESMRKSIRGMLRMLHLGKTIRHAENGRDGWRIITTEPIDMAIVDWNMPVMKGIELLELIRGNKAFRDMPVIMITAEAEKEIVAEAAESDIDGYLLKPLTTHSLDEKIRSVIKLANNPAKATVHFQNARDLEEAGDITNAIAEVKEALKERSNSSRILRKLGQLYIKAGNDDIAEKCLLKAVAVNNHDGMSRFILGELYLRKNDLASTIKYYDQAISISPRNISKGVDLGRILLGQGMATEAFNVFQQVIKYSGKNLIQTEKAAESCIEAREYGYALILLESLLKESPERYDIMLKLAKLYHSTGDVESSIKHYKTLDEHIPDNIEAKMALAKYYFSQKKVYVVDDYLNQVLKINPKHEEALILRKRNF